MQPLNFTQLSSKKHKAVRIWFYINCFLISTLLVICIFLSVQQRKQYTALRSQKKGAVVASTAKNSPYKKTKTAMPDVTQLLKTIQSSRTSKVTLESVVITEHAIEFKIAADTVTTLDTFAHEIQKKDTQINLVGLEQCTKNKMIGIFTQTV